MVQFNLESHLVGDFMQQNGKGGQEPNLQEKSH